MNLLLELTLLPPRGADLLPIGVRIEPVVSFDLATLGKFDLFFGFGRFALG